MSENDVRVIETHNERWAHTTDGIDGLKYAVLHLADEVRTLREYFEKKDKTEARHRADMARMGPG